VAKDTLDDLNKVYDEILGAGEPIQDDGSSSGRDEAYTEEDYSDDAGDGVDPRDETTKNAKSTDDEPGEDADSDGPEDSDDLDEQQDDDGDDYGEEEIDERLVQAARNFNLPDNDIIELAQSQPHVLEALAKAEERLQQATASAGRLPGAEQQDGMGQDKGQDSDDDELKIDFGDDDEFSPTAKKVVQSLVDKVNQLNNTIKKHDKGFGDIQRQQQIEGTRRIDTYFDTAAKDVPVLGNQSSLTREQIEARKYAYRVARGAQMTMEGLSDEDALAIGVNALKGQLTEQQVRTKVVSDLNRQKKRFTSRPRGRREAGKKGQSVEERALAAIDKILDNPEYS